MPLNLDYYYGNEAEQYSFYRIPKALFTDPRYKPVSAEAKVLYGLLLDRMSLSVKNGWLDENGRVYIIFTISDVMETLGCAEQKANKLLSELDGSKGVGLIERKRRGLGKPNVIYVKNFIHKEEPGQPESQIKNCENHKSGRVKITSPETRKSQTNNTDLNHTELNDTDLSIHPARADPAPVEKSTVPQRETDRMDKMDSYRALIKENIDYDILLRENPYDQEALDGYLELILEVCCTGRKTVRINQDDIPAEVVKSRFLKLNKEHIDYVMDSLRRNTTKITNIRAYTLSALYNAPVTISQYFTSLVSHDMANGLC